MNEQQRLDILKNELTDLFELQRGSLLFENCPSFAFTDPTIGHWVTNPSSRKGGRKIPAEAGYKRMLKSLGREDYFSLAVSPRKFDSTAWLSCEWDIPDLTPDEHFLKYALDHELQGIVSSALKVHWKLTGNRSVHLDVFLSNLIPMTLGKRFLNAAGHLITIGKVDKTNLTQCMRVPFSRHQKTNGLCRYAGCQTEDELMDYIRHIERAELGESDLVVLCDRMESYLEKHLYNTNTLLPIPKERNTHGIGSKITLHKIDGLSAPLVSVPSVERLAEWKSRARLIASRHPHYSKFMEYFEHGIPVGETNEVLFGVKGAFSLFVMNAIGVKAEAHAYMRELVCWGVEDEATIKNRMGRVDYIFETFFQNWKDCDGSYIPVEQLQAFDWLVDFIHKMETLAYERFGDKRKVTNLIQVMQYCLLLLYRHPEATIAGVDVERKLRISHPTALGHLRVLREDFPMLLIVRPPNHFKHQATDYRLNFDFVERVLGYLIRESQAA